jgi:hypothetical protein
VDPYFIIEVISQYCLNLKHQVTTMDTDDAIEPQQETPSTVYTAEKKAKEEAPASDGDKLPKSKAPGHGQSEQVVSNKDVKVKRDPSSTAARPGAVAVPGTGTATRETIVPQSSQLHDPGEVARPSPSSQISLPMIRKSR